jgi:hypothetical protein
MQTKQEPRFRKKIILVCSRFSENGQIKLKFNFLVIDHEIVRSSKRKRFNKLTLNHIYIADLFHKLFLILNLGADK